MGRVRGGLNVAVLVAGEAQALGGLVMPLGAAGLDVVAAWEGPGAILRHGEDCDYWEAGSALLTRVSTCV